MNFRVFQRITLLLACLALALTPFLGAQAGTSAADRTTISHLANAIELKNQKIAVSVSFAHDGVAGFSVMDQMHGTEIRPLSPFRILLKDGRMLDIGDLALLAQAKEIDVAPVPNPSRLRDSLHGKMLEVQLESRDHLARITWSIQLLDGSSYVRQLVSIAAVGEKDLEISRVELIDVQLTGAHVVGSVAGSPIVAGNVFLGFEHPISQSKVTGDRATAWIDRDLPLHAGQTVEYSSVIGIAREGQMRRDFLAYLERERAHPYRTFLHYNSWYDLGYFTPYSATDAVNRINRFGNELKEKRGVTLDSFLFDDGWDKHDSLWQFNSGFGEGFTPITEAAQKYGADPGVWMSPWGGYSKPKQERIAYGRSQGYEIVSGGYALSGPKYYAAFRDVALNMIEKYKVNQFKFDGTGNVDSVFPGSRFDSDFSAMIHLIGELRAAKPDLFVNLTTGTWPSPFWLMYADSIWRGGEDDSTAGVGTYRERWITYRDAETYQRVVQMGPLYPLNSLMLHGMIYAQDHKDLNKDPGNDFRNEIRSYFGTGTQLQEMYITPSLLTEHNWDDIAEAARWSRANADVLKDTHWVGGDPAWLEVYGWAAWTPQKGILVLRNPSDHEQVIRLRLQDAFELPQDAAKVYRAWSPWKEDAGRTSITISAEEEHAFHLAPFEVLTLDMALPPSAHR